MELTPILQEMMGRGLITRIIRNESGINGPNIIGYGVLIGPDKIQFMLDFEAEEWYYRWLFRQNKK